MTTEIEECIRIARERWGRISAYRLGRVAGERGTLDSLCPYGPGTRGAKSYAQGVMDARAEKYRRTKA